MFFRLVPLLVCFAALSFPAGSLSGRRAPGFSLPDRTGKQFDPQDYHGKVVIVDIMKTSCPNCKVVSGALEQLKTKYGEKLAVLSIVILPDPVDAVSNYIKENGITSPILFDCGQAAASYLKLGPQNPTVRFPHIFLIDGEGNIRNDFGHDEADKGLLTAKYLSIEIDKLLEGPTPKKR